MPIVLMIETVNWIVLQRESQRYILRRIILFVLGRASMEVLVHSLGNGSICAGFHNIDADVNG